MRQGGNTSRKNKTRKTDKQTAEDNEIRKIENRYQKMKCQGGETSSQLWIMRKEDRRMDKKQLKILNTGGQIIDN